MDIISKGQLIKNKLINYIRLILKTPVLQKDTAKRMKRWVIEWGEIFAKHIYDKRFISNIYKELLNFSNKKTYNVSGQKVWADNSPADS